MTVTAAMSINATIWASKDSCTDGKGVRSVTVNCRNLSGTSEKGG